MIWVVPVVMAAASIASKLMKKKGGPSQSQNNKYGQVDQNVYGYTEPQRGETRDTSHRWLGDMFSGTMGEGMGSAERYWQGSGAPGMDGGGGGGYGGRAYGGSSGAAMMSADKVAEIERAKVAMGLDDPTYQFNMAPQQEERLLQRGSEQANAATTDQWRQMQDALVQGGDATSPAAMKMRSELARDNVRAQADTLRDVRSNWFSETRGLRHAWNELSTGVNVSNSGWENQRLFANQAAENMARATNASNQTQVGMANASNATSASMANAGNSLGWANLDFDKHRFMWEAGQDVLRPHAQKSVVNEGSTQKQSPGFWGTVGSIAEFAGDAYSAYAGAQGGGDGGGGWNADTWKTPSEWS